MIDIAWPTVICIPDKSAKKIAVMLHIVRELSSTTKYPEKKQNPIIAKYHYNSTAIRRYMIEYGILERSGEGVYWAISLSQQLRAIFTRQNLSEASVRLSLYKEKLSMVY